MNIPSFIPVKSVKLCVKSVQSGQHSITSEHDSSQNTQHIHTTPHPPHTHIHAKSIVLQSEGPALHVP